MKTYTVVLVPPTGYKQTFTVQADQCGVDHANGRTGLRFARDGIPGRVKEIVIGQGMSYFVSATDSEGSEVSI